MLMDLRRLSYFLAVADQGSFTGAAMALHVSQPALSLAVKELEADLGARLLHRPARPITLTPAGEALLGPARQALRDIDSGRAAVAAVLGLEAGSLSLCCLPTLAADPLAEMIGRFRQAHPGVLIDLAAPEDTAELLELVRNGRCELGIAGNEHLDDLVCQVVATQRLVAILPPGSPALPVPLSLGHLAGTPLVTTPVGTSSRGLLEDGFARAGVTPTVAVVTAQRDAVLPLVLAGAGAALVPEPLAVVAHQLGAVVGWPDPPLIREVGLLHRRGPLAPAAQRFLQLAAA